MFVDDCVELLVFGPQRFLSFRVVTVLPCSLLWHFWEVFAEMDTNGDGVLELHEAGKLAEPWHGFLHSSISRGDGGNLEAFLDTGMARVHLDSWILPFATGSCRLPEVLWPLAALVQLSPKWCYQTHSHFKRL